MHHRFVALAACLLTIIPVEAATTALAIGVEQYQDPALGTVRHAAADARSALGRLHCAGLAARDLALLTTADARPERQPTRDSLLAAAAWLGEQADPGSNVWLLFFGRAMVAGGQLYLAAADSRADDPAGTGLTLQQLAGAAANAGPRQLIVVAELHTRQAEAMDARWAAPFLSLGQDAADRRHLLLGWNVPDPPFDDERAVHGPFADRLLAILGSDGDSERKLTTKDLRDQLVRTLFSGGQRTAEQCLLQAPAGSDALVLRVPPEPQVTLRAAGLPLESLLADLANEYDLIISRGRGVEPDEPITLALDDAGLWTGLKRALQSRNLALTRSGPNWRIERTSWNVYAQTFAFDSLREDLAVLNPDLPTYTVAQDGSGHFGSINEALAAIDGLARLLLAPGIYREALDIQHPIEIWGCGAAGQTVLSSAGPETIVSRSPAVILRGLMIGREAGQRLTSDHAGYALHVASGELLAEDCLLTTAAGHAAVLVDGQSTTATFRRCAIQGAGRTGRVADRRLPVPGSRPIDGGQGLSAELGCRVLLDNCRVTNCFGLGVGVHGALAEVRDSLIQGNYGGFEAEGYSSLTVLRSRILNNVTNGLNVWGASTVALDRCEVSDHGQGLWLPDTANMAPTQARVSRCTFANNGQYDVLAGPSAIYHGAGNTPRFHHREIANLPRHAPAIRREQDRWP